MDTYQDGEITVGSLIGGDIVAIERTTTMRGVAKALDDANIGLVVVGSAESVDAVVSERDVVRAVAAGADLDTMLAEDGGTTNLRWATVDSTVGEVIEEMMSGYLRHVLVRDERGVLVGVVSVRDLLAAYPG